jgi:hypothetical protein
MDDRVVPYDEKEKRWKFGRLLSKMPREAVSESLVFTSSKDSKKKVKKDATEQTLADLMHQISYLQNKETVWLQSYYLLSERYLELKSELDALTQEQNHQ